MADASVSTPNIAKAPQLTRMAFTLAFGQVVYQGLAAAIDLTTGTVKNGTGGNKNLRVIGRFERDYDATSGAISCVVQLDRPITANYFDNDTVAPVTAAYTGQLVYLKDNHTATLTATNNSVAGICWGVATVDGASRVLVEGVAPTPLVVGGSALVVDSTSAVFTSNDWAPTGASLVSGTLYIEGATAAASTITLPSTGVADGTRIFVMANGTDNGHTVTVRQGTTAITAALTASKKHLVECVCYNNIWACISGVQA